MDFFFVIFRIMLLLNTVENILNFKLISVMVKNHFRHGIGTFESHF